MRITQSHGRPSMHLEVAEALLLDQVLDELEDVLDERNGDRDRAVRERLYPAAYPDDGDAAAEYRSMTEGALRSDRLERVAACRAQLADPTGGADIELADADDARRWLQVLNDLRLTHGTRLGITDDEHEADIDPTDPAQVPRLVYIWLTEVQDVLVRAVMG